MGYFHDDEIAHKQSPKPTARPSFDSLPLQKDGPHGNAWGLFGDDDQLGMLNLLTPSTTLAATREIVDGVRISTDYPLDKFEAPGFGRVAFEQKLQQRRGVGSAGLRSVNDDVLMFNTQASSQWDGFRHFGYQDEKVYFNGRRQEDFEGRKKVNGIHVWAESGGIVGRGVLLDYHSWAQSQGLSPLSFESTSIPLSALRAVATAQGTSFRQGDILFVRSGYAKAYSLLSTEDARYLAERSVPPAIGVESCEEMLRWIWDSGFAAVAGDMPAFEAWPVTRKEFCLHEWLLAGWGLPIGELFDLEALAVECSRRGKWSFFFSSVPLKIRIVPGGVASPPNGVAIL